VVRVLITGITGFVGQHLAQMLLAEQSVILFGAARNLSKLSPELRRQTTCFEGNLQSKAFVVSVLQQAQPTHIYHLAGQASEPQAWSSSWDTFQTNLLPQLNLFQGMLELQLQSRFLSVGSSKVYGAATLQELPINEEKAFMPDSPYGVSKAAQDLMAQQYYLSHQLPIIRVRPFNHIGPGQSSDYVTASFARQIALAEAGLSDPNIQVGNLSAKRDFTDVRDVVAAYLLLMAQGTPGQAYNIGSGNAVAIQTILDTLLTYSQIKIETEQDLARMRPVDQPISYGDIQKINRELGWQPKISLEESLCQILNYWRQQVSQL